MAKTLGGLPSNTAPVLSGSTSKTPVPESQLAYSKCQEFLDYLTTNGWMDLWCKWKLKELMTTNLAEAFHRRLQVLTGVDHLPLSTLIDILKGLNYEARAALTRLEENQESARILQRNHQQRKEKICEEMERFDEVHQRGANRI